MVHKDRFVTHSGTMVTLRVTACAAASTAFSNANAMRRQNVIGPQVRRLRNARGWSQNQLAIKLQLEGLDVSRCHIGKIESRLIHVADEELLYLASVLRVDVKELYPERIRCSSQLHLAICSAKASRFGVLVFGLLSCSQLGTALADFAAKAWT